MGKSPKLFWNEINKLRGINPKGIDKILIDGQECTNLKKICNTFKDFFTGKVNDLLGNYSPFDPVELNENFFFLNIYFCNTQKKNYLSRLNLR